MLRALYVIAIGLLLAGVVGFGFSAFYPAPTSPEPSATVRFDKTPDDLTAEEKAEFEQYEAAQKAYQDTLNDYSRNLAIGLIIASLVIMAVSILGLGKIDVIGDGVTLGGVFTLLYGLGQAMSAGDDKIRFVAVLFGLIVLVFLTYWKFIRHEKVPTPTV